VAWRSVLVPLTVLLPLVALTPSADHRYNVYFDGGRFLGNPLLLFSDAVTSVPRYLQLGNFRPLGRIVEWSLDTAAFALTDLLGVPANIALRLVSFVAAIVLTFAAVLLAESVVTRGRLFEAPPSTLAATVPFAVAAGLVAAGRTSTTVLFGGLYFLSTALVLAVVAYACRWAWMTELGRRRGFTVLLLGAALAAFNEVAYLAVPAATIAVLARGSIVFGRTPWAVLRGAGGKVVMLLWAGFLPVFLPVRVLIYLKCAAGGCYTGSALAPGGALGALPNRLVSWLPPLMWRVATNHRGLDLIGPLGLLAVLVLGLLAVRAFADRRRLTPVSPRSALALAVVGVTILLLGAALAALNAEVQAFAKAGLWGQGWRDSGLTTVGGSLLLLSVLRMRVLVFLLAGVAVVSAVANQSYHEDSGRGRYPYLHDRIAQEIADFDRTAAGNTRRCALRAQFIANGATADETARFDRSVDHATVKIAGKHFCTGVPR
jgi:hypothetical protein